MKNLTKILCALFIVLTISCSKDGAVGPAGANGTNGNANATVKKIDFPVWGTGTYIGGINTTKVTITDADINGTVIDKGIVLAYMKLTFNSEWYNLPYTSAFPSQTEYINTTTETSKLNIYGWKKLNDGTLSTLYSAIDSLKYIIILDKSVNLRLAKPLTKMSYEEVCAAYNIKP